jgi:succinate-acetate transporter protein
MAETTQIADTTANPAPLGLLGFGMTTVLLNMHNAGIFTLGTMILAMGIFYGGMAQIFAGWMEWKKGNTFGLTAFTSYGLFWETLVFLILMPKWGWFDKASTGGMVAYLFMWGLFTFCMWIATLKHGRALQVVFFTLFILFWLLALGDATGNAALRTFTGYEGILCGLSAIYLAVALVLNETYGRTVLPVG